MKKIYTILVCLCMLASFVACEKDKDFVLTKLTIQNETITPSYGSATIDCSFKADATISEAFVQYSLSSSFAKYDVAKMTEEKGKYIALLTDLQDNTTYYIRYAVSNKYSSVVTEEVVECQTLPCTVPTIVLDSIGGVRESHAKAYLHLTFDGGASVTDMGICWGTQANPTIEDIHKSTKDTVAVLDMTDLQEYTQYYVRAYAVNKVGVSYSEEKTFTISNEIVLPTVTTATVTQITETTAVAGGNVTSDGGAEVTERGVVYSTNPNPIITNLNNTIRPCGSGTGAFTYNMTGLQSGTTYYVRAYATNEVGTAYGEEMSFTTETPAVHEYVDLGLSVKWATCNVGASKPEEYGDYFAWGETTTKTPYDLISYKYWDGLYNILTKYNTNNSMGIVDNKNTLEMSDDVAHAKWGKDWRMPTYAEFTELNNKCTWTWSTQNGVNGYKVTSKSNGNSIFLPVVGYRCDSFLHDAINYGYYWSSSLDTDSPHYAYCMYFDSGRVSSMFGSFRYYGLSVRPVLIETTLPTLVTSAVTQITETTAITGGNVTNEGEAKVTERGVVYGTNQNPTTADAKNVSGSGKGEFICSLTDLQPNTTYYVRAYATNAKGSSYGMEVCFTTKQESSAMPKYIDLGLSVKWATFNVGASKAEDYGDHFAWGETSTKSTYDWSSYKYCNGSKNTLTKYNTSSSYGIVDNKTQLELSDDAARVNWGGNWRMPTDAEWTELREQCTWSWTTHNGVNGYNVTSKNNGNSIFLPAAGYPSNGSLTSVGDYGCYWSSSLNTNDPYTSMHVHFLSSFVYRSSGHRDSGYSIRPVHP